MTPPALLTVDTSQASAAPSLAVLLVLTVSTLALLGLVYLAIRNEQVYRHRQSILDRLFTRNQQSIWEAYERVKAGAEVESTLLQADRECDVRHATYERVSYTRQLWSVRSLDRHWPASFLADLAQTGSSRQSHDCDD